MLSLTLTPPPKVRFRALCCASLGWAIEGGTRETENPTFGMDIAGFLVFLRYQVRHGMAKYHPVTCDCCLPVRRRFRISLVKRWAGGGIR